MPGRAHRHGAAAAHRRDDRRVVGRVVVLNLLGRSRSEWWRVLRRRVLQLMRVLHLALADDWAAAQDNGRYEVSSRGRTLADEGFIHTSTSKQVDGVLSRYYADVDPAELRLLVLDVPELERAGSPVRWDEVAGAPAPFPHIYGPIVPAAVKAVLALGGILGAPVMPDFSTWDVAADEPAS